MNHVHVHMGGVDGNVILSNLSGLYFSKPIPKDLDVLPSILASMYLASCVYSSCMWQSTILYTRVSVSL